MTDAQFDASLRHMHSLTASWLISATPDDRVQLLARRQEHVDEAIAWLVDMLGGDELVRRVREVERKAKQGQL